MAGKSTIPEGIISEFRKKTKELGINIDLKNLEERINKNTSHTDAFPEIFQFEYGSEKDLHDVMKLLTELWNNYPREEFCGKTPDQVFNECGKEEVRIRKLLASELMNNINPKDFSSKKEFRKAVDDFQKKWLKTPRKDMGGKAPVNIILEERQKRGNSAKGLRVRSQITMVDADEETIESFFEDVPEKALLKNIFKKEEEYANVLGSIEFFIAQYYLINPEIIDKDVTMALKNFRQDYDDSFESGSIECAIRDGALVGLEEYTKERKISKHEFLLVIDYVLTAISNRNWTGDSRAYLKWICNFFGLLKGSAKDSYERGYASLGRDLGISKEQLSVLKDPPSEISDEAAESAADMVKVGRNAPCPCGSGKKYKKCCLKI